MQKIRIEIGDLTAAIKAFDEIKDNKLGIVWYETDLPNGTRAIVRDARNATTNLKTLEEVVPENYLRQIFNRSRGALLFLDHQYPAANDLKKQIAKQKLLFVAKKALENLNTLGAKTVRDYNTLIVDILEKAGIEGTAKS